MRARYKSQVRAAARSKQAAHDLSFDEMVENGYVVIGGPDTVREQLEAASKELNIGNLCAMLQFGNMNDELDPLQHAAVRREGRARPRGMFADWEHPCWPANAGVGVMSNTIVYLPGIAGNAGIRPPCSNSSTTVGDVVIPDVPGFNGATGFTPPADYLDWLVVFWDAIDASGALADGPVDVVGASVGGMIAAELAALRPEVGRPPRAAGAVRHRRRRQHRIRPLRHARDRAPRPPVRQGCARPGRQPLRPLSARRKRRSPTYLADIAAASLLWPLGDRGLRKRLHRISCPKLVLWGGQDELLPSASPRHGAGRP